jgi:hypothetical protein
METFLELKRIVNYGKEKKILQYKPVKKFINDTGLLGLLHITFLNKQIFTFTYGSSFDKRNRSLNVYRGQTFMHACNTWLQACSDEVETALFKLQRNLKLFTPNTKINFTILFTDVARMFRLTSLYKTAIRNNCANEVMMQIPVEQYSTTDVMVRYQLSHVVQNTRVAPLTMLHVQLNPKLHDDCIFWASFLPSNHYWCGEHVVAAITQTPVNILFLDVWLHEDAVIDFNAIRTRHKNVVFGLTSTHNVLIYAPKRNTILRVTRVSNLCAALMKSTHLAQAMVCATTRTVFITPRCYHAIASHVPQTDNDVFLQPNVLTNDDEGFVLFSPSAFHSHNTFCNPILNQDVVAMLPYTTVCCHFQTVFDCVLVAKNSDEDNQVLSRFHQPVFKVPLPLFLEIRRTKRHHRRGRLYNNTGALKTVKIERATVTGYKKHSSVLQLQLDGDGDKLDEVPFTIDVSVNRATFIHAFTGMEFFPAFLPRCSISGEVYVANNEFFMTQIYIYPPHNYALASAK